MSEFALQAAEARDRPPVRPGEVVLTPRQQIALLKMRRSAWSEGVLKHLDRFGNAWCDGTDYRALAALNLALCKGAFHVLTPAGRRRADEAAMALARANDLHVLTHDYHPRSHGAASVRCTCGHVIFKSRSVPSYGLSLMRAGNAHLEHVGALP